VRPAVGHGKGHWASGQIDEQIILACLCVIEAPSWAEDKVIIIDETVVRFRNLPSVNSYAIFNHGGYTTSYYSDASDTDIGHAGYIEGQTRDSITGSWTSAEARKSST